MPSSLTLRALTFENSNGKLYDVKLAEVAGTGTARLIGDKGTEKRTLDNTATSFVFTPANVIGRDDSYLYHAPIFGPADNQPLNDILNAI